MRTQKSFKKYCICIFSARHVTCGLMWLADKAIWGGMTIGIQVILATLKPKYSTFDYSAKKL
jgi:hypothetical protein